MTLTEKNITVSSGVTRIPGHLAITPSMVDDFLIDPVMGIYVIFGVKLDIFQAYATRIKWWVPNVLDSSGFGTGKSFRVWLVTNLRALLMPGQQIVIYYQDMAAMKGIYWKEYSNFNAFRAPLFDAQKGRFNAHGEEEGKDNTRGSACYEQQFKNGSAVFGPAPNWLQGARGQAGRTFHVGVIDEWTKVETMTPKGTKLTGEGGNLIGGIDQQIIGRIRAPNFNQHHMLWDNHKIFTATAESTQHSAYQRVKQFQREIDAGNPRYALITSCFKDFSNVRMETDIRIEDGPDGARMLKRRFGKPFREGVPNWDTIKMIKSRSRAHFQREGLGLWARDTKGFYSEDALDRCVQAGIAAGTEVECARNGGLPDVRYFNGVDPAPAQSSTADDGAMSTLRLRPKPGLGRPATALRADWLFEFIWSYRVRGQRSLRSTGEEELFYAQRAGEWSGLIHKKHQHFKFDGILMDPLGGGQQIWPELNKGRQVIDGVDRQCTPIATIGDSSVGNAHFILALFLKEYLEPLWPAMAPGVDGLLTAAHTAFQDAVQHGEILYPKPFNDRPASETSLWVPEKKWALKTLDTGRQQLVDVAVVTKDSGEWDLTRNGCFRFTAAGKKDLAYSQLYAYIRALLWLQQQFDEFAFAEGGGDSYVTGG